MPDSSGRHHARHLSHARSSKQGLLPSVRRQGSSFNSRFVRDRTTLLNRPVSVGPAVTETDLASLSPLLLVYLRRAGAVGRPRVQNVRVEFDAQMRRSATAAWMRATATQYEFFDPPARLFHMSAARAGVPIDVLHEYIDGAATFRGTPRWSHPDDQHVGPCHGSR